ncbi:unnamed protein product [Spirodela intermedia]|uniref:Uncharacterized protein n=1 Tax=Spirodela intermedia TaxID=51605 RepID=A0A7I8JCH6_SPIIN|nr:unnamed protein product [Spirodela intermedia]CAA6667203.1 unnamed protein product [Spirodela intermedia]
MVGVRRRLMRWGAVREGQVYSCECDPGWTKLGGGGLLGSLLPIFPCVIPNCTLSFSCTDDTPATAAPPLTSFSASAGTLGVNLRCNCRPGYANFLNNTALACVKECFIEATCADLGSTTPADTPPPPPCRPWKRRLDGALRIYLLFFSVHRLNRSPGKMKEDEMNETHENQEISSPTVSFTIFTAVLSPAGLALILLISSLLLATRT